MSAQVQLDLGGGAPGEAERLCPVGWCSIARATPYKLRGGREFCTRHWGQLSFPMAHQLGISRQIGGEEYERTLGEAMTEIRRHDSTWHAWAVSWPIDVMVGKERRRLKLEGYGRQQSPGAGRVQALRRALAMYRAGILATVRDVRADVELTTPQALGRCRHEVFEGQVREASGSTLSAALMHLRGRPCSDLDRLEVLNVDIDRFMTYAEAQVFEREGRHA